MGSSVSLAGAASRGLLRSLAAVGLLLLGSAASRDAAADGEVVVRVAPPVPRVEVVPPAPSPHHIWAPGYWGWRPHGGHVWYGGYWIVAQPGYVWEPAHWSRRGGYWHFVEGHWRRR